MLASTVHTVQPVIQLFAEDETFNEPDIAFYFNPGMECPIDGCTASDCKFMVKNKYTRHWEERHLEYVNKYECAIKGCKSLVRRKEDMRLHIASKHGERDTHMISNILGKCEVKQVRNKGYVNPGFFKFDAQEKCNQSVVNKSKVIKDTSKPEVQSTRKRVASDLKSLVHSATTATDDVEFSVILPADSKVPKLFDGNTSILLETTSSTASTESTPALLTTTKSTSSTSFPSLPVLPLFSSKDDASSQTTIEDINNLYIPPMPSNSIEELEEYIHSLCNTMDVIGRTREAAKEKLLAMRQNMPRMQRERKLEAENRALKKQIAEIKWREELFVRKEIEQ